MTFTGRGLYAHSSKEPRRRRSGWLLIGAAVALVVLVVGGVAAFGSVPLNGSGGRHSFDGAAAVEIRNQTQGSVTVRGDGTGDQVEVRAEASGTPFAEPKEAADLEGDTVRAAADCVGMWAFTGCRVDYEVTLPRDGGVAVRIETDTGEVELESVEGDIHVTTDTGSVSGENLRGEVAAHTGTGEIDLSRVQGPLEVSSTTGSISATGSGESVVADTTTGSVELERFDAETVEVSTTTGEVDVASVFDSLRVETTTGEVDIQAQGPFSEIVASSTTGEVDVQVPRGTYRVEGDSTTGERDVEVETSDSADALIRVDTTTGEVGVDSDD
ncbi:DUF4097 domain-containing protein [Streptomonospora nanhaiensis]|uniref:DUF4097 domain-containing protein n=1 Tax=Streptomonospora nanhaiensis TaxID=1323731 RepID=A0A853BP28_9ACTN|nr:DUF4097 family beta strand repeat-containing protein [Streptomonospora nanhaiensis]MBV2361909.1 DUF4097 domain-containing protein [Streptomonospora nanhaiensis]MBX9388618.1 DUF4097 domain-containing protein [Streptomonospora nanhaiensis]NYI96271.1 hypothetical protein [Streptomonospora nanhaiensis]